MSETVRVRELRHVRLSVRSTVLIVGAVLSVFALRNAFVASQRVLGWAVAAAIAAVLVEPIVGVLGRWIPRVAAVLLTFVVAGSAIAGLVFGSIDDLDREIGRLQRSAPAATERLEARNDELGEVMRDLDVSERVDVFLQALDDRVGSGSGALAENAPTAPVYLVSAILAVFLLLFGSRIVHGAAAQMTDADHRTLVLDVIFDAVAHARRTIFALVAQGVVIGVLVWATAQVLDLPAPIVLGFVAGVAAMLPDVGILLGVLPTVALTAGFETARLAVGVLAAAFALQAVEALVLRHRIDRWGVAVGPATVWVVVLVAFTLHGIGAAVCAVVLAIFAVAIADRVPDLRTAMHAEVSDRPAPA